MRMTFGTRARNLAAALGTVPVRLAVSCILSCCFMSGFASAAGAKLSVPITVQEVLPSGVGGLARSSEPVTFGIPLDVASGITSISQLGVSGASLAQFRPLAWWPNGNIKWVLIDTQASVAAGGTAALTLTNGTGNSSGPSLAVDNGASITVDTAAAQFVVKKANFNVFDSVTVGGVQLVAAANAGSVNAVGLDNATYASSNDPASAATVEENGPVKTVIKSMGSLKSATGVRLLDYTLRMTFYLNKSHVKSELILRNASKLYKNNVGFLSAQVTVPLSIGSSKTVSFSKMASTTASALPANSTAYLYQGYNKAFNAYYGNVTECNYWTPTAPGTCSSGTYTFDPGYTGLTINVNAANLNAPGILTDSSQGFASVNGASGSGLTTAFKWLPVYWGGGFEFRDTGEASIEFFSKHTPARPLKLTFGSHESREFLWDFHTAAVDDKSKLYALQYPLMGRADLSQYASSKGIFGQGEFVTPAEQQQFFTTAAVAAAPSLANPPFNNYFRWWYWPGAGGDNGIDTALNQMLDFLRTGNGGNYLWGEQRSWYNSNAGIPHGDDFVTENIVPGTDPLPSVKSLNGDFADFEHANMNVIPLHYYLTGNESLKDSWLDYGNYLNRTQASGYYSLATGYYRAAVRRLRNMAFTYEFSVDTRAPNPTLINSIASGLGVWIDSRDIPGQDNINMTSTKGRNLQRGYFYREPSICATSGLHNDEYGCAADNRHRAYHSFFHTMYGVEAMWQARRVMLDTGYSYPRMLDLEDMITGEAQFIYKELLVPSGKSFSAEYDYDLDAPWLLYGLGPYPISRVAIWGYQMTNDPAFINMGATTVQGSGGSYSPSELQDQALMWTYLNKSYVPTWQAIPITVTDNGGGSYTLTWTVPVAASKLKIKYSDKPIVEWLGFDKVARTYQYDPAQYTAFFAANNLTSNPTPGVAGTVQSLTLTGLPAGTNFSAKYLAEFTKPASGLSGGWQ